MSTFANSLKSEIARIARKELKDELTALRKSAGHHRSEIASLKRELKTLQQHYKALAKGVQLASKQAEPAQTARVSRGTFDASKLAEYRAHLGVTQAQLAVLLQASSLSVYKWESGKVQPRAAQLERITALFKLRKRAALKQLDALTE